MKIKSISPANYELIGEVEANSEEQVLEMIDLARQVQQEWASLSLDQRCQAVESLAKLFKDYAEELAQTMSKEMGAPISNCRSQVDGAIEYLRGYIELSEDFFKNKVVFEDDSQRHIQTREAVGVIAAISPWNFPILNVPFQLEQALIAGNTIVYKPSEEIPLFTNLLSRIVQESDIPEGVLSLVIGDGRLGEFIVSQPNIDLVLFTGSTTTGQKITESAAKNSVRVLTEMGGSAPGIIFEDADLDRTLSLAAEMRFGNSGQYCDGLKRLIVHESRYQDVIKGLKSYIASKKVGNPSSPNTDFGPLVADRQVTKLKAQVQDAIEKGAEIIAGGDQPDNLKGAYYELTVLSNVSGDMEVWNEEVFGPVLPIVVFKTEEEAIDLANDTKYGLGGFIYTEDIDRYRRVASKLKTGDIAHNSALYFSPLTPFGGYKSSGNGRSQGIPGFEEVTQIKIMAEEK
jgi:succinate-semialdehyde dehydrogenase/glutarate-semialdehyde dehydrogenase